MFSKEYVRPCIRDGVLAPDMEQRLRFARELRVYGKATVLATERQLKLINAYKVLQICGRCVRSLIQS